MSSRHSCSPTWLLRVQNKLLEIHLTDLKRERIAAETARDEAVRKDLEIAIERERAAAAERAAQMRKDLELRVERGEIRDEAEPAP